MKLFRYRKPSLKTALGITKVKKAINRDLGINKITRLKPSRVKQKIKYEFGFYSKPLTLIRQMSKGKIPQISLTAILFNFFKTRK